MNQKPADERLDPTERPRLRYWSWKTAVLLAVFLLVACSYLNPRRMSYVCYYLDWCHWPRWYSVNLWALAFGAAAHYFIQRGKVRYFLYAGVLGTVCVVTVLYSAWLHLLIDRANSLVRLFCYSVFRPYFYAPFIEYFSNGTKSGRLLIAPVTAFGLIAAILFCRHIIRRNGG